MTLDDYLTHNKLDEKQFGVQIGVTQQAINNYRNFKRTPKPLIMSLITAATSGLVTANDFVKPLPTAPDSSHISQTKSNPDETGAGHA